MSAVKRTLTEDDMSFMNSIDATPDDLNARLRNIGSRVRKAVTEGYTTIRYPSEPQVSHQFPGEPSVGATIFRSAQDILRDVFGTAAQRNSPSAPSSRLKRVHDDIEQDSVLDDEDARMESNNAWHDPLLDGTGRLSRPMKPLRQARKGFVPAGMIFTSSERKHGNPTNSSDDGDTSSRLSPTPFESADV